MRLSGIPPIGLALFVGIALPDSVQASGTSATFAGARVVSADDVAKAQSAGAVVVDARNRVQYSVAHIKGAINIPYRGKDFKLGRMPANKAASIVIYCNGAECSRALTVAIGAGYRNVLWYRDGFSNWVSYDRPAE